MTALMNNIIIHSLGAGALLFIFIEPAIAPIAYHHYFLSLRRAAKRPANYFFIIIFWSAKAYFYFGEPPGDYFSLSLIDPLLWESVFLGGIFALAGPSCGDLRRGRGSVGGA